MSANLRLPDWARFMSEPPRATRYAGPAVAAVMWKGAMSRTRYQLDVGGSTLNLNVAQAHAIAEMILSGESDDEGDGSDAGGPAVGQLLEGGGDLVNDQ